jgi:hypothetical protein
MAVYWYKNLVSQTHTRAIPPNPSSVEYVYRVWVKEGASEAAATPNTWDPFTYALNVVDDGGLPRPGMTIADWDVTLAGTWAELFRIRSVSWTPVDSSQSMWECRFAATSKNVICPEPDVLRSDSTSLRRVELYIKANPATAASAGTTISSGTQVDAGGKPKHRDVVQVHTEVQFLWNTADPVEQRGYPNFGDVASYVNKRNAAAFLDFPAGSVLFAGIQATPDEDEMVRLTYQFVYDSWYHLEQQPELDEEQRPLLDANDQAETVKWFQPYEETADFDELLGAYELTWLTDGWLAFDTPGVACGTEGATATAPSIATGKIKVLGGAEAIYPTAEP